MQAASPVLEDGGDLERIGLVGVEASALAVDTVQPRREQRREGPGPRRRAGPRPARGGHPARPHALHVPEAAGPHPSQLVPNPLRSRQALPARPGPAQAAAWGRGGGAGPTARPRE